MKNTAVVLSIVTSVSFAPVSQAAEAIGASFQRDLDREPVTTVTPGYQVSQTPLQVLFNSALQQSPDRELYRFWRELEHEPNAVSFYAQSRFEADPLADAINVALWGQSDNMVASFERDLNREPTEGVAVARVEVDPLAQAISVALRGNPNQLLASFDRDLNRDYGKASGYAVAQLEADPLLTYLSSGMLNRLTQVSGSFVRDLYREATPSAPLTVAQADIDPLQERFNAVFRATQIDVHTIAKAKVANVAVN